MKPHPRIRKTIKWGGAAATLLLVVVWISSAWWWLAWQVNPKLAASITTGQLRIASYSRNVPNADWGAGRHPFQFAWGFELGVPLGAGGFVTLSKLSLWPFCAVLLGGTAIAWRLDALARRRERAIRLNLCPKCNYDRAGIAKEAVCPECGSAGGAA
jgi:hypothetical protein